MEVGPLQPSGRVIAGGRLLLSCLFLIATWTDPSQQRSDHLATYVLLGGYVLWSLSITLIPFAKSTARDATRSM